VDSVDFVVGLVLRIGVGVVFDLVDLDLFRIALGVDVEEGVCTCACVCEFSMSSVAMGMYNAARRSGTLFVV
jgi:hypothetical protein